MRSFVMLTAKPNYIEWTTIIGVMRFRLAIAVRNGADGPRDDAAIANRITERNVSRSAPRVLINVLVAHPRNGGFSCFGLLVSLASSNAVWKHSARAIVSAAFFDVRCPVFSHLFFAEFLARQVFGVKLVGVFIDEAFFTFHGAPTKKVYPGPFHQVHRPMVLIACAPEFGAAGEVPTVGAHHYQHPSHPTFAFDRR